MTEPTTVVISVRGDAQHVVAPDLGTVYCTIRTVAETKAAALRDASAAQDALADDLTHFGAVPSTADTTRQPLAWLTRSATTQPEYDVDAVSGRPGRTGNVIALVSVLVHIRDFARLDDLDGLLARQSRLDVRAVSWQVDADNPAWPEVRAEAIRAALLRGRDYAAALGGTLLRIEEVADAGLLVEGAAGRSEAYALAARQSSAEFDDAGTPSLDPVPQTLVAVIDARFTAAVPGLA